jgi:hypothetical protein
MLSLFRKAFLRGEDVMPIGLLAGYALPMIGLPTEHTYAVSGHGHVWPCPWWARAQGGRRICSGMGNTSQADCLSQPNSQAGINYGITGTCHQIANRILYPAGLTVSRAAGYNASFRWWGAYGRQRGTLRHYSPASSPWPELQSCQNNHSHP